MVLFVADPVTVLWTVIYLPIEVVVVDIGVELIVLVDQLVKLQLAKSMLNMVLVGFIILLVSFVSEIGPVDSLDRWFWRNDILSYA